MVKGTMEILWHTTALRGDMVMICMTIKQQHILLNTKEEADCIQTFPVST